MLPAFPFAVDREGILTARVYLVTEVTDGVLPSSLFYAMISTSRHCSELGDGGAYL